MLVTTFQHIAQHVADVTAEQIGKCHKVYGPDNKPFYAVANARGDSFEGQIIEYSVKCHPERGYSCTCPAGADGFARVHHASGVCKHVRWAVACELEACAYARELAANAAPDADEAANRPHYLAIDGEAAKPAEYARVLLTPPTQASEAEVQRDQYTPRPFQIER